MANWTIPYLLNYDPPTTVYGLAERVVTHAVPAFVLVMLYDYVKTNRFNIWVWCSKWLARFCHLFSVFCYHFSVMASIIRDLFGVTLMMTVYNLLVMHNFTYHDFAVSVVLLILLYCTIGLMFHTLKLMWCMLVCSCPPVARALATYRLFMVKLRRLRVDDTDDDDGYAADTDSDYDPDPDEEMTKLDRLKIRLPELSEPDDETDCDSSPTHTRLLDEAPQLPHNSPLKPTAARSPKHIIPDDLGMDKSPKYVTRRPSPIHIPIHGWTIKEDIDN